MPAEPPPIERSQAFPFPFRQRGEREQTLEVRYELRGTTAICHRWTYVRGTERTGFEIVRMKGKTAAAAREILEKWVEGTVQMGWEPVPDWPKPPAGGQKKAPKKTVSVPKPDPPFRYKPVPLGKLVVRGKRKPTRADEIEKAFKTELPASYAELLAKVGHGAYAGLLDVMAPAKVVTTTKAWRKKFSADGFRKVFVNYDDAIGDRTPSLVWLAHSINGDSVCFCAGDPKRLLILPRSRNVIEVVPTMSHVLGWFLAVARESDAPRRVAPTYVPQKAL